MGDRDRDSRLQRIIQISMAHPNGWKTCVEIMDEYSLELQRLPQPEMDYARDMDGVANWQQVHSIVQELKRDYPLVNGAPDDVDPPYGTRSGFPSFIRNARRKLSSVKSRGISATCASQKPPKVMSLESQANPLDGCCGSNE